MLPAIRLYCEGGGRLNLGRVVEPARPGERTRQVASDAYADLMVRREVLAHTLERLAGRADSFAHLLETAAVQGQTESRLAFASRERDIAAVARRNAALARSSAHATFEEYPAPARHEDDEADCGPEARVAGRSWLWVGAQEPRRHDGRGTQGAPVGAMAPLRRVKALSREREQVLGDIAVSTESLATLIENLSAQAEGFAELEEHGRSRPRRAAARVGLP